MKQSILKFLSFLEPKWMRNLLHAYIGYSLGYGFAIVTGITAFIHDLDVLLGCIGMSIFMGVGSGFYEDGQRSVFGAEFSWNDIFIATIFCSLGGTVSSLFYENVPLAWLQVIIGGLLFVLDIARVLIQKFWK